VIREMAHARSIREQLRPRGKQRSKRYDHQGRGGGSMALVVYGENLNKEGRCGGHGKPDELARRQRPVMDTRLKVSNGLNITGNERYRAERQFLKLRRGSPQ